MNKKTFLDLCFLFIIIVIAIAIGLATNSNKESFVPAINGFYRPYARKVRNYVSDKWNTITNYTSRKFRFLGLK